MNNRTEPTKEENEAAITALKAESRGEPPMKYRDARAGACTKIRYTHKGEAYSEPGFVIRAFADDGQSVEVAFFTYDDFDGGKRRDTARIFAEQLAEHINEKAYFDNRLTFVAKD